MGFFLQLRILLWKNLTLKRRTPFVLMFELFIPLVLFVILFCIRVKQPAYPMPEHHADAKPLPSAGVLAVMQAFCDPQGHDARGFPEFPNASVHQFLKEFQLIAENNNFFDPGFGPADLDHLPGLYQRIIDDPALIHNKIIIAQKIPLSDYLFNVSQLLDELATNLSLPRSGLDALLASKINFTEVYQLISNALPSQTPAGDSQISDETDSRFYSGSSVVEPVLRVVGVGGGRGRRDLSALGTVATGLSEKLSQTSDVSDLIKALQSELGPAARGAAGAALDQPWLKDLMGKAGGAVKDYMLGVLADNPGLIFDPRFGRVMGGVMSAASGSGLDALLNLDPNDVVGVLTEIFLSSSSLQKVFCSGDELSRIFIPADRSSKDEVMSVATTMCKMSPQQWLVLSNDLKAHITTENILDKLGLRDMNITESIDHIQNFEKNLKEFIKFQKNLIVLSKFSENLPRDACNHVTPVNETTENIHIGPKKDGQKSPSKALLRIWLAMQPTLCGKSISHLNLSNTDRITAETLGMTKKQKRDLGILIQMLYSNPKVLYAPNNTAVTNVIQKANGTFALVDTVSEFAHKWQNVSMEIREYLLLNDTEKNLKQIRHMQEELKSKPGLLRLIRDPDVRAFFEKADPVMTVNQTLLLTQLDGVDNAACSWLKLIRGINVGNIFQGFATEEDLVNYFLQDAYKDGVVVIASIIFTNLNKDGTLPPHVFYKIRQNTSFTASTKSVRDKYWHPGPSDSPFGGFDMYYQFGFVWIQDIIERAIISVQAGRDVIEPGSFIHQIPYPCYMEDKFLFMIEHVMPLCLTISWVYTVAMLVQSVVYEKEQRLKEVMRMMGLSNGVHWLAWFITSFTQMSITMAILTVILKCGKVLMYSNALIVFLCLEMYAVATICFSFLVSVCYSKAKIAAACAGIVYFLSYVPYMYIAIREIAAGDRIPAFVKSLASIFSTTAFGLGAKYFAFYEIEGVGVQWSNLSVSPVEDDEYNLLLVLLMLIIDSLFYGLLTWYIENVHPGTFGLPKPWYFPLTRSYWCGGHHSDLDSDCAKCCQWLPSFRWRWSRLSVTEEDQACAMADSDENIHIEPNPDHLLCGVHINNLTKKYKSGKLAVNGLNLHLYEGQITSFLGHNGAGKTTTMSMLTGLFPPTSGSASVYGLDIRKDMEEIRQSLGMCPQHNVLFDNLTVEEHLWLYGRLKGLPASAIPVEMEKMIDDLGLQNKRRNAVDCLSGGMKRKLSVAIAFMAGSRTVILDEPTAGVDPYARRAIWDLLLKYKEGRTILLSTHHMDEADLLGDRIAVISNGKLRCCGSSLFLKSTYGEGYRLVLVKKRAEEDLMSAGSLSLEGGSIASGNVRASFSSRCCEQRVRAFIRQYVQSASLRQETSQELHYTLPFDEARKGGFEHLFRALDASMQGLHLSGYGLSDSSLEEVFLKITGGSTPASVEASVNNGNNHDDDLENFEAENRANEANSMKPDNSSLADVISQSSADCSLLLMGSNDVELNSLPGAAAAAAAINTTAAAAGAACIHYDNESINSTALNGSTCLAGASSKAPCFADDQVGPLPVTTVVRKIIHRRSVSMESRDVSFVVTGDCRQNAEVQCRGTSINVVESDKDDVPLLVPDYYSSSRDGNTTTDNKENKKKRKFSRAQRRAEEYERHLLSGYSLLFQQFIAIIVKRCCYTRRNWKGLFSQILLPALFVCIAMTVALTAPQVADLPPIKLSPAQFFNYTQPQGNVVPYYLIPKSERATEDSEHQKWSLDAGAEDLVNTLHLPSGIGATCVLRSPFNDTYDEDLMRQIRANLSHISLRLIEDYFDPECRDVFGGGLPMMNFVPPISQVSSLVKNVSGDAVTAEPATENYIPDCVCANDNTGQTCARDGFKYPPEFQVVTGEHILDISETYDEELYYLRTSDIYRLHRYGGFTFGLTRKAVPSNFGKNSPTLFRNLAVRHVNLMWFNDKGYHAMPVYINSLNNAILRANLPKSKGNPAAYGITAINHPMNNTNNRLSLEFIKQGSDVIIAIFIICAMSFVPASFVVFLVHEQSIKAKHLQIVSGMNRVVYWLANYAWDMVNYLVPSACCIIILRAFDIPAYVSSLNFPCVITLFMLYGWSITPMMYPASFFFKEASTAYICLIVINLFIGITCILTSFLLELFQRNSPDLARVHDALKIIFLVFPNYCLGRGLMDVAFNEYQNEFHFKTGDYDLMKSPFEWKITSRNIVSMAVMGLVFFLITLLCEFRFFIKKQRSVVEGIATAPEDEDADVAQERRRVTRGSGKHDLLRLLNLTQVYKTRKLGKHLAVDRLSLGVPAGECFGLLGVNGAGKTTTFKMLTGDIVPTSGNAVIDNHSITTNIYKAQQKIGYCPQFDSLYDELTAREHLQLYARLRGVPPAAQSLVIDKALRKLCLKDYENKTSGTYSGGNKRKLSTAIALLGHPPIILLDEPTTGMDPHSRRFLWDLILDLIRDGHSVVLTSHSMEECEALCTRLAVMVNGRFHCLGSTQHLKDKYGDGYTLTIRLQGSEVPRSVHRIKRFVSRNFPHAVFKEGHSNVLIYELPSAGLSLADVFSGMEEACRDLHVQDYSVSQNTLDNVFINFAKKQQEHLERDDDNLTSIESSSVSSSHRRDVDDEALLDVEGPESVSHVDDVALLEASDDEGGASRRGRASEDVFAFNQQAHGKGLED